MRLERNNVQPTNRRPLVEDGRHVVADRLHVIIVLPLRMLCNTSRSAKQEICIVLLYLRMFRTSPCAHPRSNPASGTRRRSTGLSCTAGKP